MSTPQERPSRRYARPLRAGVLALVLLTGPLPGRAGEQDPPRPVVERPNWGRVSGWVIDAASREPIPGARVSLELEGAFPESGRAVDLTDSTGRYEARAPLGRISNKLDWGRVLSMNPLSLLFSTRAATKQTRIVDVTQMNVRVEAPGYRPFLGRVRAGQADPARFTVTLDDVWLAPEPSKLASFTPERLRLEVIEGLEVEPAVPDAGQKVTVRLTARLPVERGFRYRAYLTSTASRLVATDLELKRDKDAPRPEGTRPDGRVVFSREVTLPKGTLDRWTELGFRMVRDDGVALRQRDTRTLLQVVQRPEERRVAELVQSAYDRARAGEKDAAVRAYLDALKENPAAPLPLMLAGDLLLQLNRAPEAAALFRRLKEQDPHDYVFARPRLAFALIESGHPEEALCEIGDADRFLSKGHVPGEIYVYQARIHAAAGDFAEADRALTQAGAIGPVPDEVVLEINLKRTAAAAREQPNNPDATLAYARVLGLARRAEEAVQQIRRAVALQPDQPWAYLDLGTALWELGRREEGLANLRHALELAPENVEAMLALAGAYREQERYADALELYRRAVEAQKLNLRARHACALMLYATGDMEAARRELHEVVAQAREKGDLQDDGIPFLYGALYFGPKRRLVAGFSVPEAAADLEIVEALEDLDRHPGEPLLWQNIGHALLDLDLPGLAVKALEKARGETGALLESQFLLGLAYRKLGKGDLARRELQAVVAANPLHPRARLELAQLFTDEGDLAQAQAQLAAHSRNYPYERISRVTPAPGL